MYIELAGGILDVVFTGLDKKQRQIEKSQSPSCCKLALDAPLSFKMQCFCQCAFRLLAVLYKRLQQRVCSFLTADIVIGQTQVYFNEVWLCSGAQAPEALLMLTPVLTSPNV